MEFSNVAASCSSPVILLYVDERFIYLVINQQHQDVITRVSGFVS